MFYVVTTIVGDFIEQANQGIFRRRRMENRISKLRDHFIICGYGRVGKEVAIAFSNSKLPLVIIDSSEMAIAEAQNDSYLCLSGSASSDEILK